MSLNKFTLRPIYASEYYMNTTSESIDILARLQKTIAIRRAQAAQSSYVASLFHKGRKKIAQKVAEEASELAIAAVSEGSEQIVAEAADLLFHVLILLEEQGVTLEQVLAELERREGVSGLTEKANR